MKMIGYRPCVTHDSDKNPHLMKQGANDCFVCSSVAASLSRSDTMALALPEGSQGKTKLTFKTFQDLANYASA